ncbi:Sll0314/Alr1548 family TPR repeat-containing protein [Synechocystis sp. LKSZ1]|uniref:Sll0314/Alr1548 family TPR repeat-containing protein n=1 Tax=Synechocystis sp. LKSZ1 TaxID=3144951 RepID=UPI00336BDD65
MSLQIFPRSFCLALLGLALASPAFAGDPFRPYAPRNIGSHTEAAFNAIFREGNYKSARDLLAVAMATEPNEPLAFAMQASLAYDAADFEAMKLYAEKTRQAAEQLKPQDPLRGNLYLAVSYFLEGGYLLKKGNYLEAVSKAGNVFDYLDTAAKSNPDDPELNLLRGYLDLFLSKYTPFSQSDQVINRFQQYASPEYLKNRALATTYRDLKKYDQAMEYLDKALAETPENPELQYLKGQLLRIKGREQKDITLLQSAQVYYQVALQKQDQLSQAVIVQLNHENNAIQYEIQKLRDNPNLKSFD